MFGKKKLTNSDILNQSAQIEARTKQLQSATKALQQANANSMRQQLWTGVKWGFRGFQNIAQSLNNPTDPRRMRIAQMPARRSDIDIVRQANLSNLKDTGLRNRDVRGRLIR